MSAFLDDSASATGGSGLMVDGVEANRVTVSASAVQEVRINQDPYSAQYYWPGRGQMEIIYQVRRGQLSRRSSTFYFRDSALNAQNALAPSKPFEQRRIYEGSVTGPIPCEEEQLSGPFNRAEEDLDSVVMRPSFPPRPIRRGFRRQRARADARHRVQRARRASVRRQVLGLRAVQLSGLDGAEPGRGRAALAAAGYNKRVPRRRLCGARRLDALGRAAEPGFARRRALTSTATRNVVEAPQISVCRRFCRRLGAGRLARHRIQRALHDMVTWTRGRHTFKFGAGIPHMSRRAYDDNTNALGTYTFGPTLAADGVTVLETALQNYANNLPSGFSQNTGDVALHLSPAGDGRVHPGPVQGERTALPLRPACATTGRTFWPPGGWAFRRASRSRGCSIRSRRPCCAAAAAFTTTASARSAARPGAL